MQEGFLQCPQHHWQLEWEKGTFIRFKYDNGTTKIGGVRNTRFSQYIQGGCTTPEMEFTIILILREAKGLEGQARLLEYQKKEVHTLANSFASPPELISDDESFYTGRTGAYAKHQLINSMIRRS